MRRFHLQPATPLAVRTNLVHAARGCDVKAVIVDGELIVHDGRLVRIHAQATLQQMQKAAEHLMGAPPAA